MVNYLLSVKNFEMAANKCTFRYRKAGKRNLNLQELNAGKKYKCEHCDFNSRKKGNLTIHVLFDCDKQEVAKRSKKKISKQREPAYKGRKYECSGCEFKSTHKSNLSKHRQLVHEGENLQFRSCSSKMTVAPTILKRRRPTYNRKYQCSQCNSEFTLKGNLTLHMESLHERILYKCSKCDYQTPKKRSLTFHQQSVHEGKMYKCSECNYQTPFKRNFTDHNHGLDELRKFECGLCCSRFTRKSSVATHMKSVHLGMKFPCDLCDYKATQKNHLTSHKKMVHKFRSVLSSSSSSS